MSIILAEYNVKPFVMCLFLLSLTSLKMEFFFSSSILVEMTFNSFLSFFKLMSFGRYARVTLHNISLFLTILYTILCNIITTTTVSVAITNETWIFNRKKKTWEGYKSFISNIYSRNKGNRAIKVTFSFTSKI